MTLAEIILLLVIAGLVKLTAPQISIMTALAARYLFCLPLLLMVGFHLHGLATLRPSRPRPLAIRILVGLLGLGFYFAALDHIGRQKVRQFVGSLEENSIWPGVLIVLDDPTTRPMMVAQDEASRQMPRAPAGAHVHGRHPCRRYLTRL